LHLISSPVPLIVNLKLAEMIELLQTELTTRKIQVIVNDLPELLVKADSRELSRHLFTIFLRSFELVGEGGAVNILMKQLADSKNAEIIFSLTSKEGTEIQTEEALKLELELAKEALH
jgi:hypothetical protein